jgi:hypothetical protein
VSSQKPRGHACNHATESKTIHRQELYDLVWSTPVQKLAEEFGLSDRGLAKICERHGVPSPPRGYWARPAAGQKVRQPILPAIKDRSLDRIEIGSIISTLPEATREMLKQAKAERTAMRGAAEGTNTVIQHGTIEAPHKAIAPTARTLRKSKPDEFGSVSATAPGMCGVILHPDRVERAITFLHNLAKLLESDALHLEPQGERMKIAAGSDDVTFTLTERTRRQAHIPTEEEQKEYEHRQERRQRAADRKNWDLYASLPYEKPWPEFDRIHTGQLVFAIESWGRGLRKSWGDGKTQTVESMLEEIITGLKVFLAHKKAERERRQEEERQREEWARRYHLAKKRKEREEARIAHLRRLVEFQREAAGIRSWLASLPSNVVADQPTKLGRMLLWAKNRLAELERRTTVDAASAELDGKALFPEVDELHDPLGDPPEPKGYPW